MAGLVRNVLGFILSSTGLTTDGTGLTAGDGLTGTPAAAPASDPAWELEDGSGRWELEDGSGVWLLET